MSKMSAIDLQHKPVEQSYRSLTPSEVDQCDHPPDDQQSCGPRSDRDLEDEDVRHDKTMDFLLPKPESMIVGSAKKRDAK